VKLDHNAKKELPIASNAALQTRRFKRGASNAALQTRRDTVPPIFIDSDRAGPVVESRECYWMVMRVPASVVAPCELIAWIM
jgi:hypothetical protein